MLPEAKSRNLIQSGFAPLFLGCGLLATQVWAGTSPQFPIPNAITASVTQKGQRSIQDQLLKILETNSVPTHHFEWKDLSYTHQSPLLPDETSKTINSHLAAWFDSFQINPIHLVSHAQSVQLDFKNLSVQPIVCAQPQRSKEISVQFQMKSNEALIAADSLLLGDESNPNLGQIQIRQPVLRLSRGVEADLQTLLSISPEGALNFEVVHTKTNLEQSPSAVRHASPIQFPSIEIEIGNQHTVIDPKQLESLLDSKMPQILSVVHSGLTRWFEKSSFSTIQKLIESKIPSPIQVVLPIAAPGEAKEHSHTPFQLNLLASTLEQAGERIEFTMNGGIFDPKSSNASQKKFPQLPAPTFSGLADSKFDLGLSIQRQVFNEIIALSYARGNLREVSAAGQTARLLAAPLLVGYKNGKGRLLVRLGLVPQGLIQKLALRSPFEVDLELVVGIRVSQNSHRFDLVLERAIEKNAVIPTQFAKFSVIQQAIQDALHSVVIDLNQGWSQSPQVLAGDISLPADILGIPLELLHGEVDRHGHLNFYFNLERIQ